jgi:hypothetical protein
MSTEDIRVSVNIKWFLEKLHRIQTLSDSLTEEGREISREIDELVNHLLSSPNSASQRAYPGISAKRGR